MLVGYARVSTLDQNPEMQIDAIKAAGCEKVFIEKLSGAKDDRPQLKAALDYMRKGDTLVIFIFLMHLVLLNKLTWCNRFI